MKKPKQIDTGIPLYQRYSTTAKYVCFKCRVCFHRPFNAGVYQCGTCKGPTTYAGNAFRAPKKNNIREWKKLEILIKEGNWTFNRHGSGVVPKTPNEARKSVHYDLRKVRHAKRLSSGKRVNTGPENSWDNSVYELPQ